MRHEAPAFWSSTAVATTNLNHAFYKNAFAIGAGYLGNALAERSRDWDFASSDDPLGTASVSLSPLKIAETHEVAAPLSTQGTVHLRLAWQPGT